MEDGCPHAEFNALSYWLRMQDGYFSNSFRPILYLGYIWVRHGLLDIVHGLGLKSKVFCGKTTEWWKSLTRNSQCQNRCWQFGQKYPKYLKVYSTDLPKWPKTLRYVWKKPLSGIRSPCIEPSHLLLLNFDEVDNGVSCWLERFHACFASSLGLFFAHSCPRHHHISHGAQRRATILC